MTSGPAKTPEILQGKVASVLNERELTINIGEAHGVRTSMRFKVLSEKPLEVHDPETNELLGAMDREKVRVKATEVYKRFSVCRTYKTRVVGGGLSSLVIPDLFAPAREIPETLKAKDAAFPPPLSEGESFVKRGDRVVAISDDE